VTVARDVDWIIAGVLWVSGNVLSVFEPEEEFEPVEAVDILFAAEAARSPGSFSGAAGIEA